MSEQGEILKELIQEDFGIEHDTGDYYRAIQHDSLVLNYKKGLFYWNSQDISGSVEEYYKYVRGTSPPKKFTLPKRSSIPEVEPKQKKFQTYPKLVDAFWEVGINHREYWYDRLLNDQTIDRFKLGYNNGWYSIPIYKEGEFYNIQFRRDKPEKDIYQKYRRPPFLFNSRILSVVNEVIFTEGIVDAILLSQLGFPAISKNTGANGWYTEWVKYFIDIEKIYLVFDNDNAGKKGMLRGSQILGSHRCKGFSFEGFEKNGYDVIDYFRNGHTKEEFTKLLGLARMVY